LPSHWGCQVVVSTKDAPGAGVVGCPVIVKEFERDGNLNGEEATLNIAQVLANASVGFDKVLKLDADSLILEPSYWEQEGLCGVFLKAAPTAAYGFAYCIPSATVVKIPDYLKGWVKKGVKISREDVFLTSAALMLGAKDNRILVSDIHVERYDGITPLRKMKAGHYRNYYWLKEKRIAEANVIPLIHSAMQRDLTWKKSD
jgi:hypothetical protein